MIGSQEALEFAFMRSSSSILYNREQLVNVRRRRLVGARSRRLPVAFGKSLQQAEFGFVVVVVCHRCTHPSAALSIIFHNQFRVESL